MTGTMTTVSVATTETVATVAEFLAIKRLHFGVRAAFPDCPLSLYSSLLSSLSPLSVWSLRGASATVPSEESEIREEPLQAYFPRGISAGNQTLISLRLKNISRGRMSEMEIERYTSQRWRPTDDQIKMMTNIYNYGVTHPSRAQVVEIASRLRAFGEAKYDWVVMRAPRLLDLFPIPIIIDDDRDERQIPPPMPPAFRTRAPSTELTLRSPPSNHFPF
ncbi:hypothetical protein LR48_Vigan01g146700 [Vigna angularis]|uniref:Homeobox domain-containing protein n=1 Tax=Phaseolus angularis TaxID=3914 RepID=A0A0L9TN60_PHAAN|nr:hypothetical protein LR48_Vigan01g146700 [Vigna angularis]